MKREIEAVTLWPLAYVTALATYREAFKHGMLGRAHGAVVAEVYGLASDELTARRRRAARAGMAWLGLWLALWGAQWLTEWQGAESPRWLEFIEEFRVVPLVLAPRWFGAWMALDRAVGLLTPPRVLTVGRPRPDDGEST